jgi:hypothetical protein
MSDPNEEAKALQEVAKASSNAINAAREFSQFLARILGPSINDLGEIAHLHTHYWKLKNALKIKEKTEKLLKSVEIQSLPRRIGVPMIESAVNEDDNGLQDMWANLIAASVNAKHAFLGAKRAYIDTLRQLEPEEASIFSETAQLILEGMGREVEQVKGKDGKTLYRNPRHWVMLDDFSGLIERWHILRNLERLGLIQIDQKPSHAPSDKEKVWVEFVETEKPKDLNSIKKDSRIQISFEMSLTQYGYMFLRAVTSHLKHAIRVDWDEFDLKKNK